MEIKDKLLCALKSQADKIKYFSDCGGCRTIIYLKVDKERSIELRKVNVYDKKLIKKVITVKSKYFWQKNKTTEIEAIDFTLISYKGEIEFEGEKFEITKEEYDEILELREEKIKEEQIKQLDKLCKNN